MARPRCAATIYAHQKSLTSNDSLASASIRRCLEAPIPELEEPPEELTLKTMALLMGPKVERDYENIRARATNRVAIIDIEWAPTTTTATKRRRRRR